MSVTIRSAQIIKHAMAIRGTPSDFKLQLDALNYAGGSTWPDTSGAGNDAILPVFLDYGDSGSYAYWIFNGSGYATVPLPTTGDMTWSIWFSTNSNAGDPGANWFLQPMIIGGELPGDTFDMGIAMAQGHIVFGMGQPDTTMVSNSTYNDGAWHMLAVTRNTKTSIANIYVDGQLDKTQGSFPTGDRINTQLGIAYNPSGGSPLWQGNLSVIETFSSVLSHHQIAKRFAEQRTKFGV